MNRLKPLSSISLDLSDIFRFSRNDLSTVLSRNGQGCPKSFSFQIDGLRKVSIRGILSRSNRERQFVFSYESFMSDDYTILITVSKLLHFTERIFLTYKRIRKFEASGATKQDLKLHRKFLDVLGIIYSIQSLDRERVIQNPAPFGYSDGYFPD